MNANTIKSMKYPLLLLIPLIICLIQQTVELCLVGWSLSLFSKTHTKKNKDE